jgi:hypothetical protein
MGLRYPGGSPEDIADKIINQSDEGVEDLLVGTELYDDEDDDYEELDFDNEYGEEPEYDPEDDSY